MINNNILLLYKYKTVIIIHKYFIGKLKNNSDRVPQISRYFYTGKIWEFGKKRQPQKIEYE